MRLVHAVMLGLALRAGRSRVPPIRRRLWKIVSGQCVPHEQKERDPSPCSEVDLAQGINTASSVLKDTEGYRPVPADSDRPYQRYRRSGDPGAGCDQLLGRAWQARYFVDERLHTSLPRDAVSLAINSTAGRSQNQLHIHIDCIRPDVRKALAENLDKISSVVDAVRGSSGGTPLPIHPDQP